MTDYISRDAAIESFRKNLDGGYVLTNDAQTTHILQSLPAADVRLVVRGRWTEYHTKCGNGYGKIYYQHEECSCQIFEAPYNYCPNCGADMRE